MSSTKYKKSENLDFDHQKIMTLVQFAKKANRIITGHDIVVRNIISKRVHLVLLATDLSQNLIIKMNEMCNQYNVPVVMDGTKKDSLKFSDREVGITGITDINFANGILNCISHNEVED